jgi:hypothetical protein
MKKLNIILLLILLMSCKSQKSTDKITNCKNTETKDFIAYDSLFMNIDTTKLYKNKLKEFEDIESGVLLCQFLPNKKYGKFTIVKKNSNKFICYNSTSSETIEKDLEETDYKVIAENIDLNKICYFEQCDEYISNNTFYLMIIKKDNEIVTKYFSQGTLSFKEVEGNNNLNKLKSILKVMYKNSF